MSFVTYDLIFLVLFTLFVVLFLYKRRKNLRRDGLLYLYRTKVGIKFIDWATSRYKKLLKPMQYLVLASGYILMVSAIWFIVRVSYLYITSPNLAQALKVPVIMPLIPYLPELFKIDYLPPFYFTYWIIIIAVVAIVHEFAHGIFARLNKIRILSTGFGFLGPFLAAFVEQDDKQMQKSKKFAQLSVLAAGTFANVIVTILFGLILWLFFVCAFAPAGVNFNMYSVEPIQLSSISQVSQNIIENTTLVRIISDNKTYLADVLTLNDSITNGESSVLVFDDAPAINAKLAGAIFEINGQKITNYQQLNASLSSFNPGDDVIIKTITSDNKIHEYKITLASRGGKAFLGIGLSYSKPKGLFSFFYTFTSKIRDPFIHYESRIGDFGTFILDMLWWLVVINISVALVNMLPLGIFDGGRFFYLTILGITRKEKVAKWAFKFSTWFFLALIALMLVKWLFAIL
jgi:membrane-associated protease RseP (regulator of RpoE activity)